jgi:hypothetical protein
MDKKKIFTQVSAAIALMLVLTACVPTNQDLAENQASQNAAGRQYYVPDNDVEGRNYNWRQEIADDPSMIVWCTFFPQNPSSPMITVPILGKLTSGGKRPFRQYDLNGYEQPGADGMYGSSGEYRFGFGPTGKFEYYDFYGVETFCTTVPLTFQREKTIIVMEKDPTLTAAGQQAQLALQANDPNLASQILLDAINQVQGGE